MNFSHGSYEVRSSHGNPLCKLMLTVAQYHQSVIDHAREAERTQAGRPVAIALDTVGCPKNIVA